MARNMNDGLSPDAQHHSREILPSTQIVMEEEKNTVENKRKCHGNRKLQHFKRKCRARGLNEEQITMLIHTRNHTISEQLSMTQTVNSQTKQIYKRKRDRSKQDLLNSSVKSLSQLSISQKAAKKAKLTTNETMLSARTIRDQSSSQKNCTFHKPSKYLKMPRKLLLHSLRLHLDHLLKKKKEQNFIRSRLEILDQQFCLDQIRSLYQTYFDQGSQYQMWPVRM